MQIISFDGCSGTCDCRAETYSYLSCPDGMAICGMRQKLDKNEQLTAIHFKCCWIAIDIVPMTKGKSFSESMVGETVRIFLFNHNK